MAESEQRTPRRLRASCDPCHRLKLRCTFTGSDTCIRCQKLKIVCIRSQLKPAGRRMAKKERPEASTSTSPPTSTPEGSKPSPPSDNFSPFPTSCFGGDEASTHYSSLFNDASVPPLAGAATPETNHTLFHTSMGDQTDGPEMAFLPAMWATEAAAAAAGESPTSGWADRQPGPPPSVSANPSCTCFVAIACSMRDPPGPELELERPSVQCTLQQNKDALAVVADFAACECAHDPSLEVLAYVFLHKITATFAHAIYMPGQNVFRFGAGRVVGQDAVELRRHIIRIGLDKVKHLLGLLARKSGSDYNTPGCWKGRGDNFYAQIAVWMQTYVRREADRIIDKLQPYG
ncbi:uncharacterized protein K452DRAFT_303545 [Aplosporella prunicola CBS 121167]|uniref:Zn(2)-C6 fungal-type domain-containing protein n=1 Tax=Aplosporella prunicola CBS 121167 TaxID=1176127 RepID=A0A6A6AWY1_9PEZI|nr:uncharacterized protein K452DRAFT_303545 [Aplosporella prunicola CBS 121167]KAF2135444.1 hypothetical protein K452DRAFT_303545 [Aplosporella prunicola CBS 121167]